MKIKHVCKTLLLNGAVAAVMTIAAAANADTLEDFGFTYTDAANGNLTASGTLIFDATTGYVISGSGTINSTLFVNPAPCEPCTPLQLAATPTTPIGPQSMTLFTATNYTSMTTNAVNVGGGVYQIADSDGTNLTFDNLISTTTVPYVTDDNGLLFAVGSPNSHNDYDSFNIYLDSPGVLHDFLGAGGPSQSVGGTQVYNDNGPGTLSIYSIAAVPEPSNYALMLAGLGILGIAAVQHKKEESFS